MADLENVGGIQFTVDINNEMEKKLSSMQKSADDFEKSGQESFDGIGKASKKASEEVSSSSDKMKSSLDGISKSAKAAFTTISASIGIITAASGALIKFTNDFANTGDEIAKTAKKLNISSQALQEFRYAASLAGVSASDLDSSLLKMTRNLANIAQSDTASKQFQKIGLSIKDVNKLSKEQQFLTISDALRGVSDEAERTALAIDIFGMSGIELNKIFSISGKEFKSTMEEANKFGAVLSDKALSASEAMNDSMTRLTTAFTSVKNEVLTVATEALQPVIDEFATFIAQNETLKNVLSKTVEFLAGFLKNIDTIAIVITTIAAAYIAWNVAIAANNIGIAIGTANMGFYAVATALATKAMTIFNAVVTANPIGIVAVAVIALVGVVVVAINKFDEWGKYVLAMIPGLGILINTIMEVKRNWEAIKESFKADGIIEGIKTIGSTILIAILRPVEGVLKAISMLGEKLNIGFLKKADDGINEFINKIQSGIDKYKPVIEIDIVTDIEDIKAPVIPALNSLSTELKKTQGQILKELDKQFDNEIQIIEARGGDVSKAITEYTNKYLQERSELLEDFIREDMEKGISIEESKKSILAGIGTSIADQQIYTAKRITEAEKTASEERVKDAKRVSDTIISNIDKEIEARKKLNLIAGNTEEEKENNARKEKQNELDKARNNLSSEYFKLISEGTEESTKKAEILEVAISEINKELNKFEDVEVETLKDKFIKLANQIDAVFSRIQGIATEVISIINSVSKNAIEEMELNWEKEDLILSKRQERIIEEGTVIQAFYEKEIKLSQEKQKQISKEYDEKIKSLKKVQSEQKKSEKNENATLKNLLKRLKTETNETEAALLRKAIAEIEAADIIAEKKRAKEQDELDAITKLEDAKQSAINAEIARQDELAKAKETEAEKQRILEKEIADERRKRDIDFINAKARMEYEAAVSAWEIQVVMTAAQAAMAVLNAASSGLAVPIIGPATALIFAAGAAVYGSVATAAVAMNKPKMPTLQSFEKGGIVKREWDKSETGDTHIIRVNPYERVLTKEQSNEWEQFQKIKNGVINLESKIFDKLLKKFSNNDNSHSDNSRKTNITQNFYGSQTANKTAGQAYRAARIALHVSSV